MLVASTEIIWPSQTTVNAAMPAGRPRLALAIPGAPSGDDIIDSFSRTALKIPPLINNVNPIFDLIEA
jgi:hypothetical protein